jgi:D-beta-D-heptose 7-phosphate kinase/D-beta-D-heptose 1-phosphate adenosyltransferase
MTNRPLLLSGGMDPLHVGHVRLILAAKVYRSEVVIALNSDEWLLQKKGFVFMPWDERAEILRALHVRVTHVDDRDGTVCEALERVRPYYFGNGGDRTVPNPYEHLVCERLGIIELFGLGGRKVQSSSELVAHTSRVAYG